MALPCGLVKIRAQPEQRLFSHAKAAGAADLRTQRKHCGRQDQWRVSVEVLHRKSGSASPRRVFRAMLREMIEADALPDYHLEEEPGDILRVTPRDAVIEAAGRPMLAPATYEAARGMRPGWDVYALEAEWRAWWVETGRPRLGSPDKAFLGWLRRKR
jgi:plasmid replication initiation protein